MHLTFTDQPRAKAQWWFDNEDGAFQLCIDDPGWEADLHLAWTLPDMIRIVRGDLGLGVAPENGRLESHESGKARRALRSWLNLNPLAAIGLERDDRAPNRA